ncbi:MAG: glycosyltransferase [Steroidobacteraceae bacterium]
MLDQSVRKASVGIQSGESCAVIAMFVFARPKHTRRALEALRNDVLARKSELIIFSDAARTETQKELVNEVRKICAEIDGFKKKIIVERNSNYGLMRNIVGGVTQVLDERGCVIVLEDDIVVKPGFLSFMNDALNRYEKDKRVWHVSAWGYPIETAELPITFFWRGMSCWGWGTWKDRWGKYERDPGVLLSKWPREKIKRFNLDGVHDFWAQVKANGRGRLNTWAIFWYATIFEHDGLCLSPGVSYVENIGNDGSGENCGQVDIFSSKQLPKAVEWPEIVVESDEAVREIKRWYKNSRVRLVDKFKQAIVRRLC